MDSKKMKLIQRALLRWYRRNGRDLPWRFRSDPYAILVSEVMLQQTQVDRVIPKYQNFLRLFPTVKKLARAPRSAVIHAWAGLGYNRRAVYLHEAAKKIVQNFGAKVPTTIEALRQLSGVGEYTAAAVGCFAGESKEAFLDTNIKRILGRFFFDRKRKRLPQEESLLTFAQHLAPEGHNPSAGKSCDRMIFRLWHHALMDLGALVCVAGRPKCEQCPLRQWCPFPFFRDIVSRSHYTKRQPSFKNSDRFWRGRIVQYIVSSSRNGVSRQVLLRTLAVPRRRFSRLIAGLIRDGLLTRRGSLFLLPQ